MAREAFFAWVVLGACLSGAAATASAETRRPCPPERGCATALGTYRIQLPASPTPGRGLGAIVYFHGYQGSSSEVLDDAALAQVADALGVALIAPEGLGQSWSFPGSPSKRRDEFAFVAEMLDDVVERFRIEPRRLLASGFSQGGSMVWSLACRMPTRFAAFAPIAGAFWEPLPEGCSEPRPPLSHVHGVADGTVPMAGRQLRQGARQGDLFRSLAILAPVACTAGWSEMARSGTHGSQPTCRRATSCGVTPLELCLHDGGHFAEAAWVLRAWRQLLPE